jgi:hypothetical protein
MADPNPITPQTFRPIPKVDAQRIIDAIDNAGGSYTTPAFGQVLLQGSLSAPNGSDQTVASLNLAPNRVGSTFAFAAQVSGQCFSGLTAEVLLVVDGMTQPWFFSRVSGSPGDWICGAIAGMILSGSVGVAKSIELKVRPVGAALDMQDSAQMIVWEVGGTEPAPPPPIP